MSSLLALDPGLRGAGIAYFVDGVLVRAYYAENPVESGNGPPAWFALAEKVYFDFKERGHKVDEYVCEVMQVYRQGPGDPNDLIELAGVAGAVGASFPLKPDTAFGYKPRVWKGSSPKWAHQPLILGRLSNTEVEAIEETRKTVVGNAVDAVGIGLYHLERTRVRIPNLEVNDRWRTRPELLALSVKPKKAR